MPRARLRSELVSLGFTQPASLLRFIMRCHFLISPYMQLLLNVLVFNIWVSKDEMKNNEKRNAIKFLNLPCNNRRKCKDSVYLSLFHTSMIKYNNHQSEHRSLIFGGQGSFLPILGIASFVQVVLIMCVQLPAPALGVEMSSSLCADTYWPKLTTVCSLCLPMKVFKAPIDS